MESDINHQNWRFWPVILMAFSYTVNGSLIMLGIPIFFYQSGISVEIIGLLSAAQIITYCFSPLLFNKLSDKLGRKRSVILSMVGVSLTQITYFFALNPLVFFTARSAEGLFLGFFAPNLQASISDNPSLDHSKYLSRFSLSFNSGSLAGLLFGTLFLFFVDNILLVFYIAPLMIIANSVIAIIFFQESTNKDDNSSILNGTPTLNEVKYHIPVIIPILILFGFSFASGSVYFIYPIKSEILGFAAYSAYFLSFFFSLAQTISTYMASLWMVKRLKIASLISIIIISLLIIAFGINEYFLGFVLLFVVIGLSAGVLYGSALKFFMILNLTKQTSKYSSFMESLTGISYFTTQITAGIIGGLSLQLSFFTLSGILLIILIIYLLYARKIIEIR